MPQSRAFRYLAFGTLIFAAAWYLIGRVSRHGNVSSVVIDLILGLYYLLRGFWSITGFDMTPRGKIAINIVHGLMLAVTIATLAIDIPAIVEPVP